MDKIKKDETDVKGFWAKIVWKKWKLIDPFKLYISPIVRLLIDGLL